MVRAPEGFRRVGSVANAPWFNLKKGNTLRGILENMYERVDERVPKEKGGKSKFFQVKLLEGCECRAGRGEEAKIVRAEAGTVVNLNYGPKTMGLADLVPAIQAGAEYEVWVGVGEKFKISGGRTMWDLDVQQKIVKAAPALADDDSPDFDGNADEAASE
jgi:hypothetical protein